VSLASSSSNKDDEIAKLEEQLKRLKEEKAVLEQQQQPEEELEEQVDIEMFLSEEWKEKEVAEKGTNDGGAGTGLVGVLGAIALALGFVLFSQVPIGQEDLSKYSAIKAPTQQIDLGDKNRARSSIGDL
jgi:uncharacterized protein HemX